MQKIVQKDYQNEIYRKLTSWQKLEAASELYWFAREIVKKGAHHAQYKQRKTKSFAKEDGEVGN